jgi:glycerol-3-phosphate dehydrogenase
VINAAGTFAAELAGLYEAHVPYEMTPVRGEYLELDASIQGYVKHTLFPLPGPKGKGILAIPQPNGTLRLGPTATAQRDLEDAPVTDVGIAQIKHRLSDILKDIPYEKVLRTYAGLRATTSHKDFYIQPSKKNPYFIHVAGIDSPGVTAAPAIAQYVLKEFIEPLE